MKVGGVEKVVGASASGSGENENDRRTRFEQARQYDKIQNAYTAYRHEVGVSKEEFDRRTKRAREVVEKMGFEALVLENLKDK